MSLLGENKIRVSSLSSKISPNNEGHVVMGVGRGADALQPTQPLGAAPALFRTAPGYDSPNTARFMRSTTLRVCPSVKWA